MTPAERDAPRVWSDDRIASFMAMLCFITGRRENADGWADKLVRLAEQRRARP